MITGQVELGRGTEVRLAEALLVYRARDLWGNDLGRSALVSVHDVEHGEGKGQPTLGPGRLLTTGELSALARDLWGERLRYLPEHVLACSPGVLVWWEPARSRPLFFSGGDPAVNALSGRAYPQPALLFAAGADRRLRVFALERDGRPEPEAPLFAAPYWNTTAGNVCVGSTPLPEHLDPALTGEYSDAFFRSAFTHGTSGRLVRYGGTYSELWLEVEARGDFPTEFLTPLGRTLGEALGAGA